MLFEHYPPSQLYENTRSGFGLGSDLGLGVRLGFRARLVPELWPWLGAGLGPGLGLEPGDVQPTPCDQREALPLYMDL